MSNNFFSQAKDFTKKRLLRLCIEASECICLIFLNLTLAKLYGYKESSFSLLLELSNFPKDCVRTLFHIAVLKYNVHLPQGPSLPFLFTSSSITRCHCSAFFERENLVSAYLPKELQKLTKMYLQKLAKHKGEQT